MATALELGKLLALVGTLDDTEGEDTARVRFRNYLASQVTDVGVLRDYIETCVRTTGAQYNRALQDLVNRLGELLGFNVEYGRYAGIHSEIGFDGHWESPRGYHIVVEVKTTDVYSIRTATLLNYINELLSEGGIPEESPRLGLYVVGRPDAELEQLKNAIIAERRIQELRIASVNSLLALTEVSTEYDVSHDSILAILFPSGPRIDPTVDLMADLVAQERVAEPPTPVTPLTPDAVPQEGETPQGGLSKARYYLSPIYWKDFASPMDAVGKLLSAGKYAFGERTPFRTHIKQGDWICFYAAAEGVFAHAQITSAPRRQPLPKLTHDAESYPWTFDLGDVIFYEDDPVAITADVRAQLDAFADRDISKNWGWFVTATSELTEHDFKILTHQLDTPGLDHEA